MNQVEDDQRKEGRKESQQYNTYITSCHHVITPSKE
jgi:hypothetical protein